MALLLEHGIPMITGMLGTLKAGKIYVPLDPSFPVARTIYMVQDAGAQCIVTDDTHLHLAHRLAQHGQHVLNIDASTPVSAARTLACRYRRTRWPRSCTPLVRVVDPKGSYRITAICCT